jgi:hypothetical protein
VGVTSPKELEIDHLVTLKTLCEEIKKGSRTVEEVFGSQFDKEIESLFTQLKKNETEKRLLKQSYMGRAKELLEYLRERIAPAAQATQTQEKKPAQAETVTEQVKTDAPQNTEEKPKRGRPKKIDSAPEEKADTQPETQPVQEEKPATEPTTKQETGKFQF